VRVAQRQLDLLRRARSSGEHLGCVGDEHATKRFEAVEHGIRALVRERAKHDVASAVHHVDSASMAVRAREDAKRSSVAAERAIIREQLVRHLLGDRREQPGHRLSDAREIAAVDLKSLAFVDLRDAVVWKVILEVLRDDVNCQRNSK